MNGFPQMRRPRRIHHAQKAQVGFQFITEQVSPAIDERKEAIHEYFVDLHTLSGKFCRCSLRRGGVQRRQLQRRQRLNEGDCCIKVGLENVRVLLNLEVIF